MSIAQPIIDWSVILGINRRLVDSLANRYFYVSHPVPITILDAKPRNAALPLHPDFKDRGSRLIPVKSHVFIDGEDAGHLKRGDVFRLKHLYNIQVERKRAKGLECRYVGEEIEHADLKIQWVTDEAIAVELQIPDILFIDEKFSPDSLKKEEGLGEKTLKSLQPGTLIQLERKGFGRIVINKRRVP